MVYNGNSHGGEDIEIYADVLLVINFTMDFLALYLTGRILSLPVVGKRLAAASFLGALFDVLRTVFPEGRLLWAAAAVIVGISMCLVAYRERPWRTVPVFLASDLALGGLISVLCRSFRVFLGEGSVLYPSFTLPAAAAGVACALYGRSRAMPHTSGSAEVSITMNGKEVNLHMLVDSGNLLTEPLSGRAVILVSKPKLSELFPCAEELTPQNLSTYPPSLSRRLRLIPAKGIGTHSLLIGFLPDRITVNGQERDAAAALAPDSPDGFDGILPSSLT